MAASLQDITRWLNENSQAKDITHMLVVCDTYDYEDYPVYVYGEDSLAERIDEFSEDMQKVMEVYSFNKPLSPQLAELRAWHTD